MVFIINEADNSSFLGCLNLAVTDKFQNTRVFCFFTRNEKGFFHRTTTATMATATKNANEPSK